MSKMGPICVTGGSGFLGSWCVSQLLEKGYVVNTTVRSMEKAEHLKKLPNAASNLNVYVADLLTTGSFDSAVAGCTAVLHVASPFFVGGNEYTMENLLKPALDGTRNVLESCNKAKVKKVVLTASTACMYVWYGSKDESHVLSEEDWSDEEKIIEAKNWYSHSKIQTEKMAWEFAKGPNCSFRMAVMNPCLIFGPMLQPVLNTSCKAIANCATGAKDEIENSCRAIVDVRDVARAHILAMESPLESEIWGKRFLLMEDCPHWKTIHDWIREELQSISAEAALKVASKVSDKVLPSAVGAPSPHPTKFDNSRSKILLGLEYTPMIKSVKDNLRSLIKHGFVQI